MHQYVKLMQQNLLYPHIYLENKNRIACRWELDAAEQLPNYMKISFKALYDTTDKICYKVYEKHGWNPLENLKKAV